MVSTYVSVIKEAQPNGPYHLLGWSAGGLIALAIFLRGGSELSLDRAIGREF